MTRFSYTELNFNFKVLDSSHVNLDFPSLLTCES